MFTGIVQAVGRIVESCPTRLTVHDPETWATDPWVLGESVAVNGCCLTLVGYADPGLTFDLSKETWERTAFSRLNTHDVVNLERAMRPEDRFGGHIVQGHVDDVGTFLEAEKVDNAWVFKFKVKEPRYMVDKGAIAIDGVSLTVVKPVDDTISVWIVPHTYSNTSLGSLKPGDTVNIEYDVVARYVEKLLNR